MQNKVASATFRGRRDLALVVEHDGLADILPLRHRALPFARELIPPHDSTHNAVALSG